MNFVQTTFNRLNCTTDVSPGHQRLKISPLVFGAQCESSVIADNNECEKMKRKASSRAIRNDDAKSKHTRGCLLPLSQCHATTHANITRVQMYQHQSSCHGSVVWRRLPSILYLCYACRQFEHWEQMSTFHLQVKQHTIEPEPVSHSEMTSTAHNVVINKYMYIYISNWTGMMNLMNIHRTASLCWAMSNVFEIIKVVYHDIVAYWFLTQ